MFAGLDPTREMEDWFSSLDNMSRQVGMFRQAGTTPLPGQASSRTSGDNDWSIGTGANRSSSSSRSGSSGGLKAARGVGK